MPVSVKQICQPPWGIFPWKISRYPAIAGLRTVIGYGMDAPESHYRSTRGKQYG